LKEVVMSIGTMAYVTIDTVDPEALAPFWAKLLGVDISGRFADGEYVILARTGEGVPAVAFQRVPERKSGKTRIHLDLEVQDFDEATRAIEGMGGRWLEPGHTRDVAGFRWRCMSDPEGNEFDIALVAPAASEASS
jgi:predicted enzyme related to lactoylglutathione lyase